MGSRAKSRFHKNLTLVWYTCEGVFKWVPLSIGKEDNISCFQVGERIDEGLQTMPIVVLREELYVWGFGYDQKYRELFYTAG